MGPRLRLRRRRIQHLDNYDDCHRPSDLRHLRLGRKEVGVAGYGEQNARYESQAREAPEEFAKGRREALEELPSSAKEGVNLSVSRESRFQRGRRCPIERSGHYAAPPNRDYQVFYRADAGRK